MRLLLALLCLSLSGCIQWNITTDGKTVQATLGGSFGNTPKPAPGAKEVVALER